MERQQQATRHIDEACRPTGCWPSPAVPLSGLVCSGEKEAEFQVTLLVHEFMLSVDVVRPFFQCLSCPWQRCHLHLTSSTIRSLHQEAANSFFLSLLDQHGQARLKEKKGEAREEMLKGACCPLAMTTSQLFWDCKVIRQRSHLCTCFFPLPAWCLIQLLHNCCIKHIE